MTILLVCDAMQNGWGKLLQLPSSRWILGITTKWHGVTFRKTVPRSHPTRTAAYPCRRNDRPPSTGSVTDRPVRGNELHVYTVNSRLWVSFCVVWERNTPLCIFRFCFLVCRLFFARRDSVLLQWAPFNRTRDGPGQNKHATQTRTITNRTAA